MKIVWLIDDPKVQDLVTSYFKTHAFEAEVRYFKTGEAFLYQFREGLDVDCIFLNLHHRDFTNLDVAYHIRKLDPDVPLFFVGNVTHEKVLRDIEKFPDIVVEPLNEEKIDTVLTYLREVQAKDMRRWFIARSNGKSVRIYVDNIFSVEAMGHELIVKTEYRELMIQDSMTRFMAHLDARFVLSHRSFLVNVTKIKSFSRDDILLVNGDIVPMSRRRHQDVTQGIIYHSKFEQEII